MTTTPSLAKAAEAETAVKAVEDGTSTAVAATVENSAPSKPRQYRIGSVPYLNSRPLTDSLAGDVQMLTPSKLATELREAKLDVGLVPVVECLENPEYALVDGFGICCRGPVHSVILSHEMPMADVRKIAVDQASKTSVALARLIVQDFLKRPEIAFVGHEDKADAHLWIGDPAIEHRKKHPEEKHLDLGSAWWQWHRLPFVFAVWALRGGAKRKELADILRQAARDGLAKRASIAETPEQYDYLTKRIRFELGTEEKRGLSTFAQLLAKHGILKAAPKLEWM